MKVLWVTTFPPRRCGIGDYAADLADALTKTEDLHLRVLTYRDGLSTGVTRTNGFEVSRALGGTVSARGLKSEIRTFEPDIVHLQSASFLHPPGVNGSLADSCEVPLVTTVHDTPSSWRVFHVIPGLRKIYKKTSCFLVHSRAVARTMSIFQGIDEGKVVEIAHGVDLDRYSPRSPRGEVLGRYGLEGQRIILFFGFVRPGKGLETLLEAWKKVESSFADAILVVAGGVPTEAMRYHLLLKSEARYPARIRRLTSQLGLSNRVVFTGYVPGLLVPGLLAAAEIVVLPYEGGVSQSGPLHKALASGCAIVATNVPGFQALLDDGNCGVLVPPQNPDALAEAIRTLLEDRVKARALGRQARETAENSLGWSTIAARTFGIYHSLQMTESRSRGEAVPHT